MIITKRMLIATIIGLIFGVICWKLASSDSPMAWYLAVSIILSRTILGFAIGISSWKINWWLHGILLGLIFSLPGAFAALGNPNNVVFIFLGYLVMGMIYGFLIELITTYLFKAGQS